MSGPGWVVAPKTETMKQNCCGTVRVHLENSACGLVLITSSDGHCRVLSHACFFEGVTEKEIRVLFSFSQISWDSMKEKTYSTTASCLISQCFPVFQAEYLVFASIHSTLFRKRVFSDHTQQIANLSNEAGIEEHVLKCIPGNVVQGNYSICWQIVSLVEK